MNETNIKYSLNLKFTKLEAPEVGFWAKTFQMAGHNECQQPPKMPSPNNKLGESYVAGVQENGKHVPLLCTDAEEHEHLTNHYNKQLNAKILDTFKDILSNVNIDSIQERYPKISVYNKIIVQYMNETNIKYSLNLKFTTLEAPEVGFWAKTFQVADHNDDQQPPKEQQSEPPKPQPHQPLQQQMQQNTQQMAQQTALLMSELPIAEQGGANQMISMAAQQSHSTPVMLPIIQEQNGQYMHHVGQCQHSVGYAGAPGLCPHR